MKKLKLQKITGDYAVCRLAAGKKVPSQLLSEALYAIIKDTEETTIVLPHNNSQHFDVNGLSSSEEWEAFRILGSFSFDETGIVLSAVKPLSENGIGVFVLSTFSSDILMVKRSDAEKAVSFLAEAGHTIVFDDQQNRG